MSSLSTRCPPSRPRAGSPWTANMADSDFRAASYAVTNAAAASSVAARIWAEDRCNPGLGKDGPGMSRVGLDALNLPAVKQEPRSGSVRQPAEVTCGRAALSHRLPPG